MNYWHIQLKPDEFNEENVKEILQKELFVGIGDKKKWSIGEQVLKDFNEVMQVNDIVVVRRGRTPIALVRVKSKCYEHEPNNSKYDSFRYRREIEILDYYKPEYQFEIDMAPATLTRCADHKRRTNKTIIEWHEMYMKNMNKFTDNSIALLKYKKQIILQGPPGTGKTRQAKIIGEKLAKAENIKLIQFHPAYSYEDFVRGIVAKTTEDGKVSYQVENKVLADFAEKASKSQNEKYVLIIDEINRANLPAVLGELIYALEYRDEDVISLYEYQHERKIVLPKNLYIIGTMNTADRSVGHIDYAIRRRFAFVDILPDESVIDKDYAKKLFQKIKELFSDSDLSSDFKAKDVMIGHSYFLVNDETELKDRLEYEIKPILREYLKDGILLDSASKKIESLNV